MAEGLVTYSIDKMRVTRPKGKTAERNPERVFTVSGVFYSTVEDDKGKTVRKDKLSFASKNVDVEDTANPGFAIDTDKGLLTLPEGKRGRTAAEGMAQGDILAVLDALRNPEPEAEAEAEAEA